MKGSELWASDVISDQGLASLCKALVSKPGLGIKNKQVQPNSVREEPTPLMEALAGPSSQQLTLFQVITEWFSVCPSKQIPRLGSSLIYTNELIYLIMTS